ncbi:MAG: 3-deoxy-manno-octulosonate cytidylyltransferase [Puniceicoccales bacterium]|nr:3-deoxy-manno-octulosonate cytidylyltransferase [Puniceicoccales bacterium]
MKTTIAIPARLASSRFPGKVLADLCGKPVIQWVYEAAQRANIGGSIHILVDSKEVESVAKSFCDSVIMTSPDCHCGTARIVSALDKIDGDFVINIQGDEPLLDSKILAAVSEHAHTSSADIVTPIFKITDAKDIWEPSLVKVAVCRDGRALYFSRSPIPFLRGIERSKWLENFQFFGHIGMYGYRRSVLENYENLHESALELAESLEQLRFLDNGYTIDTIVVNSQTIGVDTPADLQSAIAHVNASQKQQP